MTALKAFVGVAVALLLGTAGFAGGAYCQHHSETDQMKCFEWLDQTRTGLEGRTAPQFGHSRRTLRRGLDARLMRASATMVYAVVAISLTGPLASPAQAETAPRRQTKRNQEGHYDRPFR
jgi:hypothetical protein